MTARVLFVCLGNICRSPTAHAIFQQHVNAAGLNGKIIVDSAGTGDWHIGRAPDTRSTQAALLRGYDMRDLVARQVQRDDFRAFNYVLAMDQANLRDLKRLSPPDFRGHLGLFLDFHPSATVREVPDPYYGGEDGFHAVLDLVEAAADGLLVHVRNAHGI